MVCSARVCGMQDSLLGFYLEPDNIQRLHEALCDLHCGYIESSVRMGRIIPIAV